MSIPVARTSAQRATALSVLGAALAFALVFGLGGWQGGIARAAEPSIPCILVVQNNHDSGAGSLRDTIACAPGGSTISFDPSLAGQTIVLTTTAIAIATSDLTIDGSAAPGVRVDGNGLHTVFNVSAPLTILTLTIQNGSGGNGGGLSTSSPVTLTNVAFLSNQAASLGGGLYAGSVATLLNTSFINNLVIAGSGGGAYLNGAASVSGGSFEGNTLDSGVGSPAASFRRGGGLFANGTLNLTGTQFLTNGGVGNGGGLFAAQAVTLSNANFQFNSTTIGSGIGAYVLGAARVYDSQFGPLSAGGFGNRCLNSGCDGGGLFVNGTLVMSGTNFTENIADARGGGVLVVGAATITGGVFLFNGAGSGGGLYVTGTLTMTGTELLSNTATSESGGGLYAVVGATVTNGSFIGNKAHHAGGGAYLNDTAMFSEVLFQDNTASPGGPVNGGGGLWANTTVNLTGTQFISNSSTNPGGGVHATAATVTGGQFISNTSNTTGGGLYVDTLDLTGTQFLSNSSVSDGGGLVANQAATLTNAIFTGNLSGIGGGAYLVGASSVNGGSFQNNQCTFSGCQNGGWLANGALSLTQFITVADFIQNDGPTNQAAGGVILFNGSQQQTIAGSGSTTFSDMWVNNTGAGVWLGENLNVTNRLTLTSDLTTTGAYVLNLGASASMTGTGDVWGRSVRNHPFVADTTYAFGNPNVSVDFTSGTLPTQMTVDLTHTVPAGANFSNSLQRYYDVSQVGGSGFTATLRLHYQDSEINGNNEASLQLWHYPPGGPWTALPIDARDTTANWLESNAVSSFSPWAVSQNGPAGPTAVRLDTFGARPAALPSAADAPGLTAAAALLALGGAAGLLWRRRRI